MRISLIEGGIIDLSVSLKGCFSLVRVAGPSIPAYVMLAVVLVLV